MITLDPNKISAVTFNDEAFLRGSRSTVYRTRRNATIYYDDFEKDQRLVIYVNYWAKNKGAEGYKLVKKEWHDAKVTKLSGFNKEKHCWTHDQEGNAYDIDGKKAEKFHDDIRKLINMAEVFEKYEYGGTYYRRKAAPTLTLPKIEVPQPERELA